MTPETIEMLIVAALRVGMFMTMFGILLSSIIIHELAHAMAAYRLGDPTARELGRFSFNPLNHLDPVGSLALPVLIATMRIGIVFGYAKPVRVCRYNLRNPKRDMVWVALAGPGSNLLLATGFALLFALTARHQNLLAGILAAVGEMGFLINVFLMIVNLLPIPPLDGSHLLLYPVPFHIQERYSRFILISGLALLILVLRSGVLHGLVELLRGFLAYIGGVA